MKLFTLPLLILAGITTCMYAEAPAVGIQRTFRVITNVGTIGELKFDHGASETTTLNIQSQLSNPMLIPEAQSIVLYREIPAPLGSPANTPPTKETMATISFPQSMTQAIVVIAATSPSTYGTAVFDDSLESHPANTLKVFNLSRMATALKVKKETFSIAPNQTTLCPYPPGPTSIQVAVQRGGDWALALDEGRISRRHLRGHIFVFNYQYDPSLHDSGPPPPALVRFYVEGTPVPPAKGVSLTAR